MLFIMMLLFSVNLVCIGADDNFKPFWNVMGALVSLALILWYVNGGCVA